MQILRPADFAWIFGYFVVLGAVVGGVFYGRSEALRVYEKPQAQADWEEWREEQKKQSQGKGPVQRREPKSDNPNTHKPPALVLLGDYFAACLVTSILLSSVLYATFALFLRGALASSTKFVDRSFEQSPPNRPASRR